MVKVISSRLEDFLNYQKTSYSTSCLFFKARYASKIWSYIVQMSDDLEIFYCLLFINFSDKSYKKITQELFTKTLGKTRILNELQ